MVQPALVAELAGTALRAEDYVQAAADLFTKKKGGDEDEEAPPTDEVDEGDATETMPMAGLKQPIVLGAREIEALVAVIAVLARSGVEPDDIGEALGFPQKKKAKPKGAAKKGKLKLSDEAQAAVKNFQAMRAQPGLDAQLFGRFSTANLFETVDGAVSVAHLLTVHPMMNVPDYFTVQDMLQDPGEAGASHANTTEIASGLFYGYVVLDLRTLARNLPAATSEELGEIAAWLVRAIYQVESAAKRGSTAPFGATHEILVELGRRQPRTLAARLPECHPARNPAQVSLRRGRRSPKGAGETRKRARGTAGGAEMAE